jgi:hypothetical protein
MAKDITKPAPGTGVSGCSISSPLDAVLATKPSPTR